MYNSKREIMTVHANIGGNLEKELVTLLKKNPYTECTVYWTTPFVHTYAIDVTYNWYLKWDVENLMKNERN